MSFNVVEVDNPELRSGDKGTSVGANITSNPIDADTEALHVDGSNVTQPVSAASLPLPSGAATEATLSTRATEATVATLATEATVATLATESKLEAVRALLATIDADTSILALVDYATETTLDALLTAFNAEDFASETKLEAVRALLATIDADTSNLDVALSTRASEATVAELNTRIGDEVAPATGTVNKQLADLVAKDFATETTLSAADGRLTTIDAVLDGIKDTDGIKKITDPVVVEQSTAASLQAEVQGADADGAAPTGNPVLTGGQDGANVQSFKTDTTGRQEVIGGAATGIAPAGNPVLVAGQDGSLTRTLKTNTAGRAEQVLYDGSGHPIAVILDNSIYRLETRSSLVGQVGGSGSEYKVTTITDTQDANQHRLQTEARIAPGSTINIGTSIPSDPSSLVIDTLKNSGSESMRVNGSGTPVVFTYSPPTSTVLSLQSLLFVFSADDITLDGESFGSQSTLTNGILIKLTIDSVVTTLFTILRNEDFLRLPGRPPIVNNTGPKDFLAATIEFGGLIKLTQADGDIISVTVQDNLTHISYKYLRGTVFGALE